MHVIYSPVYLIFFPVNNNLFLPVKGPVYKRKTIYFIKNCYK